MLFKRKSKKNSTRCAGYYWVKWSSNSGSNLPIWRIAYYSTGGIWTVVGDTRLYTSDSDFLEIGKHRIPRYWYMGAPDRKGLIVMMAIVLLDAAVAFYVIYQLIKSI